jgi:hypothetical protein
MKLRSKNIFLKTTVSMFSIWLQPDKTMLTQKEEKECLLHRSMGD